ncbi:MAG: transposase [Woeseiaceae bacterium]
MLKGPPARRKRRGADRHKRQAGATETPAKTKPRGDVITTLRRYYHPHLFPQMTPHQRHVMQQLLGCRSGRYGSRAHYCPDCRHGQITLNSCGNRHCTRCGDGRRSAWRDRMAAIALSVPYLHNVYTTPHEFNAIHTLSEANVRAMVQLIFDSSIATIKKVLKREKYGIGTPAMIMTLHSWGQRMLCHVHVHTVLVAGGISVDGKRWIQLDLDEQALAELKRELAAEYRRTYLRRLRGRIRSGKIQMSGDGSLQAADALIAKVKQKDWMVDLQASPQQWEGGPEGIINYLASYVSGAAISDVRIVEDDGRYVTIAYKDYRQDKRKCTERMRGEEFVRRFVMHFLPPYCRRIRYGGFYSPQERREKLDRVLELITEFHGGTLPTIQKAEEVSAVDDRPRAEGREELFLGSGNERKTFPATCRFCKQYMDPMALLDAQTTLRILPYLVAVMQWLSGQLAAPPKEPPRGVPYVVLFLIQREHRCLARRQAAIETNRQDTRGSPTVAA